MKKLNIFPVLFVVLVLSYVVKIPYTSNLSSSLHNKYYYGLLGIYLRIPRDCSWLGCGKFDPFPFTRDKLLVGVNPFYFKYVGSITQNNLDWNSRSEIFRDNKNVVMYDKIIKDGDPDSIIIKDGFAVDSKNVYLSFDVWRGLDTASFEILGCDFYRDKNGVYDAFSNGKPETIVDIDTFEMIWKKGRGFCNDLDYTAQDKNYYYTTEGGNGIRWQKK